MGKKTSYLTFHERECKTKTKVFEIINIKNYSVGFIKWFGAFRKYSFEPNEDTIWDSNCLLEVVDFIDKLMLEHKLEKIKDND